VRLNKRTYVKRKNATTSIFLYYQANAATLIFKRKQKARLVALPTFEKVAHGPILPVSVSQL
jgi:hypothetical protein